MDRFHRTPEDVDTGLAVSLSVAELPSSLMRPGPLMREVEPPTLLLPFELLPYLFKFATP